MSSRPQPRAAQDSYRAVEAEGRAALVADGLLTVAEAAAFLRLSRSRLYELMDAGELAYVKIGRSRRLPRRAVVNLAARSLRGGTKVL